MGIGFSYCVYLNILLKCCNTRRMQAKLHVKLMRPTYGEGEDISRLHVLNSRQASVLARGKEPVPDSIKDVIGPVEISEIRCNIRKIIKEDLRPNMVTKATAAIWDIVQEDDSLTKRYLGVFNKIEMYQI